MSLACLCPALQGPAWHCLPAAAATGRRTTTQFWPGDENSHCARSPDNHRSLRTSPSLQPHTQSTPHAGTQFTRKLSCRASALGDLLPLDLCHSLPPSFPPSQTGPRLLTPVISVQTHPYFTSPILFAPVYDNHNNNNNNNNIKNTHLILIPPHYQFPHLTKASSAPLRLL